jgi:DNA-binding HxlR family transcriptional regulator
MRTYAQYCPIAKATEVLGERWSLLIMRDMLPGRRRFNELARGLPGISRAMLAKRLRQLEAAALIARDDDGYVMTEAGADLEPVIMALAEWGARHAFTDPAPEELDPDLLLWWIHGRIDRRALPDRIVVVQFTFADHASRYWLVVEPQDTSVCLTDPGFEIDVEVRTDLATLYQVWLGRDPLADAVRDGRIELRGSPALTRTFSTWFQRSPVAYASSGEAQA